MGINLVYNTEKIKARVSMRQIVSLYEQINSDGKILCPFHPEQTPSFHIYENGGFCWSCRTSADIFAFVMKKENISFLEAVKWVADKEGILPEKVITEQSHDYRGPVPGIWISHWHDMLTPDRREYLHRRLLTDETIDSHMIGYDEAKDAYVIPYYRGVPGDSEIDIFQYRASPDKVWPDGAKSRRYWGKKGYNKPSVLGRHLINKQLVIILFGTVDQLSAEQDGLPAISISAIEGFTKEDQEGLHELKRMLKDCENIVIVPDGTIQEFAVAHKLADILGAKVRYFPKDCGAKDYNEYKMTGHTAAEFIEEVLQMPEFMWFVDSDHVQRIFDILDEIADGKGEGALTILQVIVTEKKYHSSIVNRGLQYACERQSYTNDKFTSEEWMQMAADFFECNNYLEMLDVIKKWSDLILTRQGAF